MKENYESRFAQPAAPQERFPKRVVQAAQEVSTFEEMALKANLYASSLIEGMGKGFLISGLVGEAGAVAMMPYLRSMGIDVFPTEVTMWVNAGFAVLGSGLYAGGALMLKDARERLAQANIE